MHAENYSVLPSYVMGTVIIAVSFFTDTLLSVLGVLIIMTASLAAIVEGRKRKAQIIKPQKEGNSASSQKSA